MSGPDIVSGTGVSIGGRGLLIEGPSGSGKSTLALALIDRGAILVGDDAVTMEPISEGLRMAPPPNIAGKLEIRNVGIVDMEYGKAPLCLILKLTGDAPRYVETAERVMLHSASVPCLRFDPSIRSAAIRAEWALARWGLQN